MLDSVVEAFSRWFAALGRLLGRLIAWLMWPFVAFRNWLRGRGWFVKIPVFTILVALAIGYAHLFYVTQFWKNADPDFIEGYDFSTNAAVGARLPDNTCQRSQLVQVVADLISRNVDSDVWVPSHPLAKVGLFGIDWKETPFFDNKAAFQLGVNQTMRRTVIELVDRLGRVRGTSSVNPNLQQAREAINYREDAWFITLSPPFLQPTTQARMRDARARLNTFNDEVAACRADFDARADNLLQFLDRVSVDIGDTSAILQGQLGSANFIGFDRRADDRFWFAYGQLYAYKALMKALRSDFRDVVKQRNLELVWDRVDQQLDESVRLRPWIVVNGSAGSIIKSHLESIGFALLRVRSNLVEMRDVLDR